MSEYAREEKEPEHKTKFVSLKEVHFIWNGQKWIHFSTIYSSTHIGPVREKIKAYMEKRESK